MQPDDLEELRSAIARDRGDAHLRCDLVKALIDASAIIDAHQRTVTGGDLAAADHGVQHLEGEVGVDSGGAVADESGEVVRVPCGRCLDHQIGVAADAFADESVVHRTGGEERVHRQLVPGHVPVREHQDQLAVAHRGDRAIADVDDGVPQLHLRGICEIDALVAKRRLRHRQELSELAL